MRAQDITEEGWYWCKFRTGESRPVVIRVFDNDGYGLRMEDTDGDTYDLKDDEWPQQFVLLGPISPPSREDWLGGREGEGLG